jgi:hypothetical protein
MQPTLSAAPSLSIVRRDRIFHTGMAVAFLLTAFAGFAQTYFLKGFYHTPPLTLLVHMHGLVFTAWLIMLLVQTALVASHRVDLHRRLGVIGALLAAIMIPIGVMTALASARRGMAPPGLDPLMFLIIPLGSVAMFAGFVGAALWKRRDREIHRRLMLLGTISIMAPAIARMPFVALRPAFASYLALLFVLAAIIYDWRSRGRVHSIYIWGGLIILLSSPMRFGIGHTSVWKSFARLLVE